MTADVYVALLELLNDPEPFVVAKGVEGLSGADMAAAVEPLAKAAERHPDLAPTILPLLAHGSIMRLKAMPHLRKFTKHQEPRIRAAAIAAICSVSFDDAEEELLAGLADKESQVRLAAASAAVGAIDGLRESAVQKNREAADHAVQIISQSPPAAVDTDVLSLVAKLLGGAAKPAEKKDVKKEKPAAAKPVEKKELKKENPADAKPEHEDSWWDEWLRQCYAGRNRPKWTARMVPPLEKMLRAEAPKERAAAAVLLAPLGKAGESLPVLRDTLRANPELLETAVKVLPWLVWEERLKSLPGLPPDGQERRGPERADRWDRRGARPSRGRPVLAIVGRAEDQGRRRAATFLGVDGGVLRQPVRFLGRAARRAPQGDRGGKASRAVRRRLAAARRVGAVGHRRQGRGGGDRLQTGRRRGTQ